MVHILKWTHIYFTPGNSIKKAARFLPKWTGSTVVVSMESFVWCTVSIPRPALMSCWSVQKDRFLQTFRRDALRVRWTILMRAINGKEVGPSASQWPSLIRIWLEGRTGEKAAGPLLHMEAQLGAHKFRFSSLHIKHWNSSHCKHNNYFNIQLSRLPLSSTKMYLFRLLQWFHSLHDFTTRDKCYHSHKRRPWMAAAQTF